MQPLEKWGGIEDITSLCTWNPKFGNVVSANRIGNIVTIQVGAQSSAASSNYENIVTLPSNYTILALSTTRLTTNGAYSNEGWPYIVISNNQLNFRNSGANIGNNTGNIWLLVQIT